MRPNRDNIPKSLECAGYVEKLFARSLKITKEEWVPIRDVRGKGIYIYIYIYNFSPGNMPCTQWLSGSVSDC